MAIELNEAAGRRTSRGRFIRQVGLAVFAAVPVVKAIAFPRGANAEPYPAPCQYVTCEPDGYNCCADHKLGTEEVCRDNFTHEVCYYICVTGSTSC